MQMPDENIILISFPDIDLIKPTTPINLYTVTDIKNLVHDLQSKSRFKYIFDMEEVNFIDSSGIGFLIKLTLKLKQQNVKVKFINIQKNFFNIFQVSGLIEHIDINQTIEIATNSSWDYS